MKLCMLVRLLSGMSFSDFGGQRSKIKVTSDKNVLSAANTHLGVYEWYVLADCSMQQRTDERISWLRRGDFSGLHTLARLSAQLELGAAA